MASRSRSIYNRGQELNLPGAFLGYPIIALAITKPATITKIARLAMSSASICHLVFFSHLFGPVWTA